MKTLAPGSLEPIRQLINDDLEALDQAIHHHLNSEIPIIDDLSRYIIDLGGKRLRPLIALLASQACDYQGHAHIDLAAAIEFFHTATLLHDDVVDESLLRRGQQTANHIWGEKASILVGDYLFTRAIQLLVACQNQAIVALMADTSNTISKGEILQLMNCQNPNVTIEDYMNVTFCKTAILFATATESAALLSQRNEQIQTALRAYGTHLGNAFQIVDDVLDYSANSKTLGKNIGDDLKEGKTTLPLIIAMQRAQPSEQSFIKSVIRQPEGNQLDAVIAILESTEALEQTLAFARQQCEKAITALSPLDDSPHKEGLKQLARYATQRDF